MNFLVIRYYFNPYKQKLSPESRKSSSSCRLSHYTPPYRMSLARIVIAYPVSVKLTGTQSESRMPVIT